MFYRLRAEARAKPVAKMKGKMKTNRPKAGVQAKIRILDENGKLLKDNSKKAAQDAGLLTVQ